MGRRKRYLRFASDRRDPEAGIHEGLFCTAYRLRDEGDLVEHQAEELNRLLRWFDQNLSEPRCFS